MEAKSTIIISITFLLVVLLISPAFLHAEDSENLTEEIGVGLGVTVGNSIYLPIKATLMAFSLPGGALSWILSGGNEEITNQIWSDYLAGPYVITPEMVRSAIGKRPELESK